MKLKNDLDYVKLYAEKLRDNKNLFEQQKKLINSQLKGSSSLFRRMFKKKDFNIEARKYLESVGLR